MSIRASVAVAFTALAASTAMADFSGYYDPFNWGFASSSDGFVDIGGAPASIVVAGPNDGSGDWGYTDFFIDVPSDGTFSFDWEFGSDDIPEVEAAGYINNSLFFLSDNPGDFGSISVPVSAGDAIGFTVESLDNLFGRGYLTVSNFSAPTVPEPLTLGVLAALGVLALRRRA